VTTAGSWEISEDAARFTPRFAAAPGTRYVVIGREPGQAWREVARVAVPESDRVSSTIVETIEPSVNSVPANLLRFAVNFSAPIEEGSATAHVRLVDETGAILAGALLEMPPELWDRDRRRLTVLLEPGRIKRGLRPNAEAGPPLREGGTVTLVVAAGIRDAEGSPLVSEARRTYRVGAPIRSRIDPTKWDVRWPSNPSEPLVVSFDRPLDRALVQRYVRVLDRGGNPVAGQGSLDNEVQRWTFTPAVAEELTIHVDARLEDLAGNSVRRVFDRDLHLAEDDGINAAEVVLTR
jgi:hypothetical protein